MGVIKRRGGQRHIEVFDSADTITIGDAVQYDENGEVVVATSGAEVLGVALEAANNAVTVTVDVAYPGDEWEFPIETGTMAGAEVGEEADINTADGITLTESHNDVLITGWDGVTTSKCYGVFKNLARGA